MYQDILGGGGLNPENPSPEYDHAECIGVLENIVKNHNYRL